VAILYGPIARLALPDDGNQAWGGAIRQNFETLEKLAAASNCYYVSPAFTDAEIHTAGATDPRFFQTIQAAHDAIPATYGHNNLATIFVEPGQYTENLTITKCVRLVAHGATNYRGYVGGVIIAGTSAALVPTVTVTAPSGQFICVGFDGFGFQNVYSGAATTISQAQLLKVTKQTVYGASPVTLTLQNCDLRAQTWGVNNDWAYGIHVDGYADFFMRRCAMVALNFNNGGVGDSGIANVICVTGDNANSKPATALIDQCAFSQAYAGDGAGTGNRSVFYVNNRAAVVVARTSVLKAAIGGFTAIGITGTNSVTGLAADTGTYGNLLNIDLANL
jgi:hypothetical protein